MTPFQEPDPRLFLVIWGGLILSRVAVEIIQRAYGKLREV